MMGRGCRDLPRGFRLGSVTAPDSQHCPIAAVWAPSPPTCAHPPHAGTGDQEARAVAGDRSHIL